MTITIKNQIKDFKNYLTQLGYGQTTCKMLPACVEDFLNHTDKEPEEIRAKEIESFYEWLQHRPNKQKQGALSEQYINHHIYALRVFFNWQETTHRISYNPMSVMQFKKPQSKPRQPFTQDQIRKLFNACSSAKERAVLHLFYSCGLRRTEAVKLNTRDLHFKTQMLYVREGKGAKRRAVPMSAKVSRELEAYYLEERIQQPNIRNHEAFILDKRGRRASGDTCNRIVKELLSSAGIEKEISLHHLRHSIATHLLEGGLTIESVRDFLGHTFLESTQIYAKVNQGQLNNLKR